MTEVIEKDKCCGCGACYTACGHNAITMLFDDEGFEYPVINQKACIDCGLCQSSCPVIHYDYQKRKDYSDAQKGYAARNVNYEQRLISSSGSIFPVIAEYIIDNGGIVVGVTYDEQFNTKHLIIDKKEDIIKLQGSKYLQCKPDNTTYRQVKKELIAGRNVLYSGMACQVEGLKQYLRKEYDNLYTIDLICMGIPSPKVWQIYLDTFFNGEKIKHVNFKEKSIGWDCFCFHVDTDKRTFKERGMDNLFLQSMFRSWNMRVSCFLCPFKKAERISDFTLADCWGASRLVPDINDNKGLSSVIVHSKKGQNLWNQIKTAFDSREISIAEIAKGNKNLIQNKEQSGNRAVFYEMLHKTPKDAFIKLCSVKRPSLISRIIGKMKIRKLFSKSFWAMNNKAFRDAYDYDMKFNASFRGKIQLSKKELKMLQIKYIWYYRKAQATKGTIWSYWYMFQLKRISEHTGIFLNENMNIPRGLIIGHPGSVIINGHATFDGNIFLTHGVTIGRDVRGKRAGSPHFGKNVCIRCNSTVVGGISIGEDVLIAPNTFVNFDVPSHSIVIGNPATIHHRDNATEGHIGKVEG